LENQSEQPGNLSGQQQKASELEVEHKTHLTAKELSSLWSTYMHYTFITCFVKHFLQNVEDQDVKLLLEDGAAIANHRVSRAIEILSQEQYPIPTGFSDEDLVQNAPRLYSDVFYHFYLQEMITLGLGINSICFTGAVRSDVREFYHECILSSMRFFNNATDTMLAKGIMVRPPYITTAKTVDFVKSQDFLTGFLGRRRPLLTMEIASLHQLVLTNFVGKSLLLGFKQVCESNQVRAYISRGVKLSSKIIDTFGSFLSREDLPVPMIWDSMVTDSAAATFSDKLIMFHISVLTASGFQNMGNALSTALRHDISANLYKTQLEIAGFAEDGINIMIDNGWLEEPPRLIDRREIN
jgi:hypothetical protein